MTDIAIPISTEDDELAGLTECPRCGKNFKPDSYWCPTYCEHCTQEGPDMPEREDD